jgi:hypothetical protein
MTCKPPIVLCVLAAAILLPDAALTAQQAPPGAFQVVESGRSYPSLQAAIDAVGHARATIRIAPGTWRQCAVQQAGVIVYEAAEPGKVTLAGRACEGKAALVLRGKGAEIRGLTFSGIKVPDGNGAGIRLEAGSLTVSNARFENSQQGILSGAIPGGRVFITRSTFSGLGSCENEAGCAHSLYIGNVAALTVRESRFERGTGGHYLKARAAEVVIEGNSFDDSGGRGTNYMIDLPAGSRGRIANNLFIQGRDKENYSAFIALGAEERLHPSAGLRIENNEARFVPGLSRQSTFLANWTGERVVMQGNRLAEGIRAYAARSR